ncbi:MAG: nucleotidyl transferase AbiEii/AbiGii toxin family protein, partial [Algicola sp.]|nr:nucleotidyl transferase AbiEii/AbiGii toxin family protein [Algicola sp.]
CHGSNRFSDDLNFAGSKSFANVDLIKIKQCLEKYLGTRYGLEITVKEPKALRNLPEYSEIKVDKWQVAITTAPAQKDMAKQKIKIEVANIDAYTAQPKALILNYDGLPDGYANTLIQVESLNEIMADKLISLANTTKYIRHRDIWDLVWLKQKRAVVDGELVKQKIADYAIDNYLDKVAIIQNKLPDIVNSEPFQAEMQRFIAIDVQDRTLNKAGYNQYLSSEIIAMYEQLKAQLNPDGKESKFPM